MTNNDGSRRPSLLVVALAFLTTFFFGVALTQPISVLEIGALFGLLGVLLLVIATRGGPNEQ